MKNFNFEAFWHKKQQGESIVKTKLKKSGRPNLFGLPCSVGPGPHF